MKLRPFCFFLIAGTLSVIVCTLLISRVAHPVRAQAPGTSALYMPMVLRADSHPTGPRVNVPYFPSNFVLTETAIFWLCRVNANENYADVRIGYNPTELLVHVAVFDRRVWYDSSPSVGDLTAWDALSLVLDLDGNTGGALDHHSYRFV